MKVGIIGFGNMGEALGAGLSARVPGSSLLVFEKDDARCRLAVERFGARPCGSAAELASSADLIVIAVKPQSTAEVVEAFRPFGRGRAFISVVAGKPIEYFRRELASDQIVRFMPNLAARNGKAFVGVTIPPEARAELRERALLLARSIGLALELPEDALAAVTGLSGSGIAFVFEFIHALALGGVQSGLAYPTALTIALQVLEGAVELVRRDGEHPAALVSKVASPAGTTIAGIRALESGAFRSSVIEAVTRATERARELER